MEYLLVTIFQLLGIGFNVIQKIIALGETYPQLSQREVVSSFFKSDWDTLILSGLILALDLCAHFVFNYYQLPLIHWEYYVLVSFGVALVLGYAGQRMIYKYLGSAEKFLDKKVTDKLQ